MLPCQTPSQWLHSPDSRCPRPGLTPHLHCGWSLLGPWMLQTQSISNYTRATTNNTERLKQSQTHNSHYQRFSLSFRLWSLAWIPWSHALFQYMKNFTILKNLWSLPWNLRSGFRTIDCLNNHWGSLQMYNHKQHTSNHTTINIQPQPHNQNHSTTTIQYKPHKVLQTTQWQSRNHNLHHRMWNQNYLLNSSKYLFIYGTSLWVNAVNWTKVYHCK